MMQDDTNPNIPIKVIKPVFLTWVVLFSTLPLQLHLTVLGIGVGGSMGFLLMLFFNLSLPIWYPFVICGLIFFLGTPLLVYLIGKHTYDMSDYRFYRDYLEYTEGFWTVERKIIQYKHITQVYLRKSILQRMYGVGTIYLSVPAMASDKSNAGIQIADIKNPEAVYKAVLQIIG